MNKENAKQQIKGLLEKYDKVVVEEKFSKYTEADTKAEFIEPLFEALGWDVRNRDEVTREETISKGRVDYGFRISGIPKFFLEAKALREDLDDPKFAGQAINYAWHKGCTWAVLTDFDQGVKIFNAEWKTTDPSQSRPITISRQEFLDRFEELWLLSKESFEQGLLDKEAVKWGKKTKKTPVGEQLLNDLTKWRAELSKDILWRNRGKHLTEEELDEAVQRIIDRLIFIRNCEDRELEPPTLLSAMREWDSKRKGSLAENIVKVFKHFDKEYNSKLFEPHLCDSLDVSNQVLEGMINGLDHTEDRTIKYDFSVLDADVLGNVYEQYLGHILKKTAKRATLTKKHARRKEQGIYYTPTYIVDYIVRNTLGELLKDKKAEFEKIKVLDPACGSGSFLIKAFDVLNEYYSKHGGDYSQTQLDLDTGLPFKTKEKILQNNIFGVDLDGKAVEIAQLNLLLKIAEKKRRLPMLQQNIKCGNSLIDDEKIAEDKAFKWEQEFSEIMKEGGFDVVIGNPPYVNIYLLAKNEKEVKYYQEHYFGAYKKFDLYVLFIEKAIKLLKDGGYFSFIIPDKFLSQPYGLNLRKFILDNCSIKKIVNLSGLKIFEDATVENIILVLKKDVDESSRNKNRIEIIVPKEDPTITRTIAEKIKTISQSTYRNLSDNLFRLEIDDDKIRLKSKIESNSVFISKICYVNWGARSGDIKTFVTKEKKNLLCKPMLDGRDIDRYDMRWDNKYLIYDKEKLYNPMFEELFENDKLIIRDVNAREGIKATFDNEKYYTEHTVSLCLLNHQLANVKRRGLSLDKDSIELSTKFNLKYILGILNSKLMSFYFKTFIGCGLHVYPDNIRALPIKLLPNPTQQPLIHLVDEMLSLNKRLDEIGDKRTDERQRIEEEVKKTDAEIDELVYRLYDITESERKIIEGVE